MTTTPSSLAPCRSPSGARCGGICERPSETTTFINPSTSVGVDAHSSPANQAGARSFLDRFARPAQDAPYAETKGSLTQYEFPKDEVPGFHVRLRPGARPARQCH